jgi:hypothetical protein
MLARNATAADGGRLCKALILSFYVQTVVFICMGVVILCVLLHKGSATFQGS